MAAWPQIRARELVQYDSPRHLRREIENVGEVVVSRSRPDGVENWREIGIVHAIRALEVLEHGKSFDVQTKSTRELRAHGLRESRGGHAIERSQDLMIERREQQLLGLRVGR